MRFAAATFYNEVEPFFGHCREVENVNFVGLGVFINIYDRRVVPSRPSLCLRLKFRAVETLPEIFVQFS
jgi:hypothetical protein